MENCFDGGHSLGLTVTVPKSNFRPVPGNPGAYSGSFAVEGEHLCTGAKVADPGFLNTEENGINAIQVTSIGGAPKDSIVGLTFSHGDVSVPTTARNMHANGHSGMLDSFHVVHPMSTGAQVDSSHGTILLEPAAYDDHEQTYARVARWKGFKPEHIDVGVKTVEHVNANGTVVRRKLIPVADENGTKNAMRQLIDANSSNPHFLGGVFSPKNRIETGGKIVMAENHYESTKASLEKALQPGAENGWKDGLKTEVHVHTLDGKPPAKSVSVSLRLQRGRRCDTPAQKVVVDSENAVSAGLSHVTTEQHAKEAFAKAIPGESVAPDFKGTASLAAPAAESGSD